MDPKAIAVRKAAALERIDAGLGQLVQQFKFDAGLAEQLKRSYSDPELAAMFRLEQVAELVCGLAEAAFRAEAARGVAGLPDGRELAAQAPGRAGKGNR